MQLAALSLRELSGEDFYNRGPSLARDTSDYACNQVSNMPCHSSAPSLPQKHGAEPVDMHQPTSGRTSGVPDKTEVRDRIAKALTVAASSAKPIARETGASVDTAEGWRAGINIPGGYNLIVLARQFPAVRAVVRQLIDCDFDQDPRAYALFIEAMNYAQGRVK